MAKFWYIVRNFAIAIFLLALGPLSSIGVSALMIIISIFLIFSAVASLFKSGYYINDDGYIRYATLPTRLIVAAIYAIPGYLIMKYGATWVDNMDFVYIISGIVYIALGIFRLVIANKEKYLDISKFGKVISFVYPLLIILSGILFLVKGNDTFATLLIICASVFWCIRTVMVSRYIY